MRTISSMLLSAAAAFASIGCESHTQDHVSAGDQVAQDGAQGALISGGVAVDFEPDRAKRIYIHEDGYPPGTYVYNDNYYYGGYRYSRDALVNAYVRENRLQRRDGDVGDHLPVQDNFEPTAPIISAPNAGIQQTPVVQSQAPIQREEASVRRVETARPAVGVENRTAAGEEDQKKTSQAENRATVKQDRGATAARPENKAAVAKEQPKAASPAPTRGEGK